MESALAGMKSDASSGVNVITHISCMVSLENQEEWPLENPTESKISYMVNI